ncbi:MAG: penicillin acylase family protein [Deltaproteobacteria bacterium]|nr:penicillin acylase family protein [Deltaproteobacteria bacterium]
MSPTSRSAGWTGVAVSFLAACAVASASACSSDESASPGGEAGSGGTSADGGQDAPGLDADSTEGQSFSTPVDSIALSDTIQAAGLSAPVDMVRDEWGIPHIYAQTLPDASFAQGYMMAHDRFPEMDFARRSASGTLAELLGGASAGLIDADIRMRVHHLRKTATDGFEKLKASSDPTDKLIVAMLGSFSAGVNAYLADLKAGKYTAMPELMAILYMPKKAAAWSEIDTLTLGELQAFNLAFNADEEIHRSLIDAKAAIAFDQATDPSLKARAGIAADFQILSPIDPTHTIQGWTGMGGDSSTAALSTRPNALYALLEADRDTVRGVGLDYAREPSLGSNNWILGPTLSATGHVLVANDTHLDLPNPATFYLSHVVVRGGEFPTNVMGVQFPGIPGVILGMNEHVAWGATVNYIDVTDVYQESVVTCDGSSDPCVLFNGAKVPLTPRVEKIGVGMNGDVTQTVEVTLYDVPHHGPVIPRILQGQHSVEPLGPEEMSIRYTGYESAPLLRAVLGVDRAGTMQEAVASLDKDFRYGGQNWVIGDDQGNFGWTQTIRVPRRAAGHAPWKVMPGDGTAEWGADMDPKYIPHAYNPAQGFLVTANADPIGVTDDGDPFFDEPVVDGSPLYLGASYDPGTRAGRITKRLKALVDAQQKVSLEDMQSIQADAVSEWAEALAPALLDAATALAEELAQSGKHPELSAIAAGVSATTKPLVQKAADSIGAWKSFDTPSGAAEDNPTAEQIADSRAALLLAMWRSQVADAALGDELQALGTDVSSTMREKLLVRMIAHPDQLKTGLSQATGDALLWDDLSTPTFESKREIGAKALVASLDALVKSLGTDFDAWRWGSLHTLTLDFLAPVDLLKIPTKDDPSFPNGFPRHGDNGTVDVANHGLSVTDFSYSSGPAIRFVCDLDPAGAKARNVLPGGEIFDSKSPHYRDQMELWRKNQTFDLAFKDEAVVASASKEYATNKLGRIRFTP